MLLKWPITLSAVLFIGAMAQGCATNNPYYDPKKPHHRPDGFVNSDGSTVSKSFSDLVRWYKERFGKSLPPPPGEYVKSYADMPHEHFNTNAFEHEQHREVAWLGHASVLVKGGGITALTDPQFSERSFPVQWAGPKRKVPSPLAANELPPVDVVLISHNHYDHLDEDTVKAIAKLQPNALFLVPLGVEKTLQSWGIEHVKAMDWWDTVKVRGSEITFVPARHWSARTLLDRNCTLWGGWVVKNSQLSFYFTGDTGYGNDFREIGKRLGPFDLSAIAIGAYQPRWFMKAQHIDPAEAVQIHKDVGSRQSLGVHWGTFELTDEPLDQPIGDLQKAKAAAGLADDDFVLLPQGGMMKLKR